MKNNNSIQAFWVGVSSFSAFAFGLISAAILSRYFEKTEYGTYRQILYVYNTLLIIFTVGLPRVFNYFLPRYSIEQGKDIVFKVSKLLFLFGLVFSIFLFIFSGLISNILKNPELSKGLKYFSPVPMLFLPTLGIEGIFSSYKKTIFIAVYSVLTRILMIIFVVLPVILFKGTYLYAVYGWVVASIITLVIAIYIKGIPFKGIINEKSNLAVKEILKYSLPLVSASIAGIAIKSANQFYISRYFGTEVFAEFANGFIEIPFVHMITGATATVLMPMFSKIIYEKSDVNQLVNLWKGALQKSVILIYPMVFFFLFYSKDVMTVLYSNKYSVSSKYFITAMTLNFFNVIVFTPLLLSLGKTRFYSRLHIIFAIIKWSFGYLIVIIFKNPLFIAIFSVLVDICIIGISLKYSSKLIGVPFVKLFPVSRILIIALHSVISLSVVTLLLRHFLPQVGNLLQIVLAGFGFLILLWISSKWFKISYFNIISPLVFRKER